MLRFRSFKTRILVLVLSLLLGLQVTVFVTVDRAAYRNGIAQIRENLRVASGVFERLVAERTGKLQLSARLLSADYAFKAAFGTGDTATIQSAMRNHQERIGADRMGLYGLDGYALAGNIGAPDSEAPEALMALFDAADASPTGEAAGVLLLDDAPYRFVAVPLLVPLPEAWIVTGFRLDGEMTDGLHQLTQADISLLTETKDGWRLHASTMPDDTAEALRQQLATMSTVERRVREWTLAGETDIALPVLLAEDETGRTYAVLRRPLAQVLAPYYRLRKALLVLTIASLAIAILASVPMAASVTRPVQKLLAGVRHVQSGDYEKPVDIRQQDEIGELASAFNDMTLGLAERDKVRNLLGKVVDPAVAGELLARGVDLGGEEREATILFCDLRDFTAFSETLPPRDLLSRLNDYLTRMTAVIEAEGGIIDKYIGDAIMAIYGAPLAHGDDPARAVRAALGMQQALHELNSELTGAGLPAFDFGIGINTARVVAGNMGSATRLNYTVIGDGVNLAARIEGLTKEYGEPVIVSEGTRAAVVDIAFMELDQVQVKGRQESVRIYAPLGPVSTLSAEVLAQLSRHEEALVLYRDRQWQAAADLFEGLRRTAPRRIHDIYIQRCQRNMAHPPAADWQPVEVYERK